MRSLALAILGFGHVGRALAQLLARKSADLAEQEQLALPVTGVASRRLGWHANPGGLVLQPSPGAPPAAGIEPGPAGMAEWLTASRADVLVELTSLNPRTGQPSLDHVRQALAAGLDVVTANKGPVVFGYRELRALADRVGRRFLFESTVMDGLPIFSLFRETLPTARLDRLRGILNSTTNFVLTQIEAGLSFEEAVRGAQAIGIAETDPTADIDGWDAAVKVCALVSVLMDYPLLPEHVERTGIGGLAPEAIRRARAQGRPFKLICRAERQGTRVQARVAPEQLAPADPLASVSGTASAIHFETDVLPGLSLFEGESGPETTAYGVLADLVRIARDRA